jgi:prepilin signal peptidase PulO-like enzyme (type II secretory pathway)
MISIVLALLGLCFGSFANALVWRLHKQHQDSKNDQKYSISKGRSMCVHCGHTLHTKDLIPVLSWAMLKGKCRYCQKPISWQYPVVELVMSALFVFSYAFWLQEIRGLEIIVFGLWLTTLVGLVSLVVYDLRWMLLPNRIVFPLYGVAAAIVVAQMVQAGSIQPFLTSTYGVAIGGGLFYFLFQLSKGRWIGGGDVKLGFLLGAIVGGPELAVLLLFLASVLGTLGSIPLLASKKVNRKTRIPFGPFLICAAIVVELFGETLTDWYLNLFLL